ncbi:MAG: ComEC/Rec2 family competence protein [Acidobacteria bacterium]|nr:ComEC/Rec2 family competence protein [Acidobacteriota bacterium]
MNNFVGVGLLLAGVACASLIALSLILRKTSVAVVFICAAFLSAGYFVSQAALNSVRPDRIRVLYDSGVVESGSPVDVEGVVQGAPEPSVDGSFLNLRVDALRAAGAERVSSGNVRIFVPSSEDAELSAHISQLKYGSRIRVSCELEREDEFLNPGVMPKREMLDRQDIDATCTVKSALLIEHIADESVFLPIAWSYNQRAKLISVFHAALDQKTAGVMIASLLGDKYFLDKETADLFREGGTFHILVISGLHITFIGGLLLLFARYWTRNRWVQFAVTMPFLWAYALTVGADVPVVRAAVMFTVVLFGYAIHRRGHLSNSFGFCALVLLVWRPQDIWNPSFQLTFVSVGSILCIAYPLIGNLQKIGEWTPTPAAPFPPNVSSRLSSFCEWIYWRPGAWRIEAKRNIWSAKLIKSPMFGGRVGEFAQKIIRYVFEAVAISLIVQIVMLPLSIVYFHRVSLGSFLLNLWIGLFIAVESFAAVIGALLSGVSTWLGAPLFAIADGCNWLLLSLPRLISGLGWGICRLPAYAGNGRILYFVYFIPVIAVAFAMMRWDPFKLGERSPISRREIFGSLATLVTMIVILIAHPFSAAPADGKLHIDFLDVGQGDSALVTFPGGRTLLIDGGGRVDYRQAKGDEADVFEPDSRGIGEAVVSEVLWYKGLARVDYILATHADADHIQGLNDVAKNFSVGKALFSRSPASDPEFAEFADTVRRQRIASEKIGAGDTLNFGEVSVDVLYPDRSDDPAAPSDNDHSVVLRISFGDRSILMTGDIERTAESSLLKYGANLNSDVVKVPHHGSRTSSTDDFVAATGPQYAVISVGRHSPFGHPHPEVVERWRASGSNVMTTGERGMISVSTDGHDLTIEPFMR